jgi:hypothetical protein
MYTNICSISVYYNFTEWLVCITGTSSFVKAFILFSVPGNAVMAHLTVFYSSDGEGWFVYLKSWLEDEFSEQDIASVDSLHLDTQDWSNSSHSDFLIIILSPELFCHVSSRESEFHQLHNAVAAPCRTFGLYLGLEESQISEVGWNGFNEWAFSNVNMLDEARDSIKNFIKNPLDSVSIKISKKPMGFSLIPMPCMQGMLEELKKKTKSQPVSPATEDEEASNSQSISAQESPSREKEDTSVQRRREKIASLFPGGMAPMMPKLKPISHVSIEKGSDSAAEDTTGPGRPSKPLKPATNTRGEDKAKAIDSGTEGTPGSKPPKLLFKQKVPVTKPVNNSKEKHTENPDDPEIDGTPGSQPTKPVTPVVKDMPCSAPKDPDPVKKSPKPRPPTKPVVVEQSPDSPDEPDSTTDSNSTASSTDTKKLRAEIQIFPSKVQHKVSG